MYFGAICGARRRRSADRNSEWKSSQWAACSKYGFMPGNGDGMVHLLGALSDQNLQPFLPCLPDSKITRKGCPRPRVVSTLRKSLHGLSPPRPGRTGARSRPPLPGATAAAVRLTRHRSRRPDQAIADGAPLGLVGRHHDDNDVQVERIAFMKDRIEPLTGGFGLREFHKVKCVGKIGKGCGS